MSEAAIAVDPYLKSLATQELQRRLQNELCRFYIPNGGLERLLNMIHREVPINDSRIHIIILRAGNGVGKTALGVNIAAYLSGQYENEYLDRCAPLKQYRRPNKGRILTTATAAQTVYDEEFSKWLPRGKYRSFKNGHRFQQLYQNKATGCEFDILTFDQDPSQAESTTLDWAIVDEPMPAKHFTALKSRFRFGGCIFMLFTALEGSGWYKTQLESEERLGQDVHVMELSSEENCREHGVRGLLPHAALESQWADFDEVELPARKDGKYMQSSGVIYPFYRDEEWTTPNGQIVGHVVSSLQGYHRECYDLGLYTIYCSMDPHDRKPFAIGWDIVFPNQDAVRVAEWPDDSLKPFRKIRSCALGVMWYAQMIKATEQSIFKRGADFRVMDPNFGNAIKSTSKSTVLQEMEAAGKVIDWPLRFFGQVEDSLEERHIKVRSLLGNPGSGVRPKYFVMAHCLNTRFAFKNYAYKENRDPSKGLSVNPEYVYKDFADTIGYNAMMGLRYLERMAPDSEEFKKHEAERTADFKPRRIPSGFVGMA